MSAGAKLVLEQLYRSESDVVGQLTTMMERHAAEHEIFHVSHDIRLWSLEHIRRISAEAAKHDQHLDAKPDAPTEARHLKEMAAKLVGRRPETGVLLLNDLRDLYVLASVSSLNWEAAAQLAQATRDSDLLALATECHPQTLRQIRWANTMIKTQSPQVLTSL